MNGRIGFKCIGCGNQRGGGVALGELKLSVNRKILNPVGSQADGMPLYGVLSVNSIRGQTTTFLTSQFQMTRKAKHTSPWNIDPFKFK